MGPARVGGCAQPSPHCSRRPIGRRARSDACDHAGRPATRTGAPAAGRVSPSLHARTGSEEIGEQRRALERGRPPGKRRARERNTEALAFGRAPTRNGEAYNGWDICEHIDPHPAREGADQITARENKNHV